MIADWLISSTTLQTLFGIALIVIVLTAALIDCRAMILPDSFNLALAAAGIGQAFLIGMPGPVDAALGALLAFSLLWLVANMFRSYRGIDGLGFGDLKFAAAAGLWIGWEGVAPMLLIASCSALVFVVVRSLMRQRFDPAVRLPFGPFLGLGTTACWIGVVPKFWA